MCPSTRSRFTCSTQFAVLSAAALPFLESLALSAGLVPLASGAKELGRLSLEAWPVVPGLGSLAISSGVSGFNRLPFGAFAAFLTACHGRYGYQFWLQVRKTSGNNKIDGGFTFCRYYTFDTFGTWTHAHAHTKENTRTDTHVNLLKFTDGAHTHTCTHT